MSGKREQTAEMLKKSEKTVISHREFLDMDTDEEDFGRQESPELEEELPLEPEKPVFSKEDLTTLVNCVKNLIVYPTDNVIWNECFDEIIEEYFKDPSHTVLSIFFEKNELNAVLDVPTHASKGFTYFLRSPWQVYTPENFLKTVSFGSINDSIRTVLKYMENIYAPIVLRSEDYASFLRNDVFENLHEFVIRLMEEVYWSGLGLTTLYVPKERLLQAFTKLSSSNEYFLMGGNQMTAVSEEDERKRKLVNRLEKVVWFWIRQIFAATITSTRRKVESIQDEVDYWKAKNSNLHYLQMQLLNPEVQLIVNILKNLNSSSASKLGKLTKDIEAGLEESSSNLMYLNILHDFCKDLKVPEDVENSVTEALLLVLFIWTESPFYSTTNNMDILCQALSSQIMNQCKKYIKLDVIFGNNPEGGIQMIEKCILCCNVYKTIYDNLTINVVPCISADKKWDINQQEVFNEIHAFKQRCYDMIEVCKALIVFGRSNKTRSIGGPRGTEYEAYWEEIEFLFHKSLDQIIMARHVIFDVTKFVWLRKMKQFKRTVLQLENMVINLINDIFENVKTIEEGIEAIHALEKFKKGENLQKLLQKKWLLIWKMFNEEIKDCYMNAIQLNQSKGMIDVNVNLLCVSQYLKCQHSVITNALEWIGASDLEECVLQQYEYVLDVIDKRRNAPNVYSVN